MAVITLISKGLLIHTQDSAVEHCLVTFRPRKELGFLFSS